MKITELLDNPEVAENPERLAARCMMFTTGHECGHVDEEFQTLVNQPCMACGVNVERRMLLFSSEQHILKTIFECYRSIGSKSLCVLLFCTLIEHHLRKLLEARCRRLKVDRVITTLLLDKYWKVHDRLKLFERLTGTSIRAALGTLPGRHVFAAYDSLQKNRNKLAHGEPWAHLVIKDDAIRKAVNEAANSFPAFAHLYHRFCAADSPPLPTS